MAGARRRANKSQVAQQALEYIRQLYEVERSAADLDADARGQLRQEHAKPILDQLHQWLTAQRQLITNGTATAKAIDYSLKRWTALTRYLNDGNVPHIQ